MKLSLLSICLGLGFGLPQVYGLVNPTQFTTAVRKFPRSLPIGWFLMLLGTAWFLYIVNYEPIADFSAYKNYMMMGFGAVGVLACIFVSDFLAVRGLAIVLLLLAKLMVDTGRPHLGYNLWDTPFVVLFQGLAYCFVIVGMWLTVSPWRLRDWLNWITANEQRVRVVCLLRLAFYLFIACLGFTAFRSM